MSQPVDREKQREADPEDRERPADGEGACGLGKLPVHSEVPPGRGKRRLRVAGSTASDRLVRNPIVVNSGDVHEARGLFQAVCWKRGRQAWLNALC